MLRHSQQVVLRVWLAQTCIVCFAKASCVSASHLHITMKPVKNSHRQHAVHAQPKGLGATLYSTVVYSYCQGRCTPVLLPALIRPRRCFRTKGRGRCLYPECEPGLQLPWREHSTEEKGASSLPRRHRQGRSLPIRHITPHQIAKNRAARATSAKKSGEKHMQCLLHPLHHQKSSSFAETWLHTA